MATDELAKLITQLAKVVELHLHHNWERFLISDETDRAPDMGPTQSVGSTPCGQQLWIRTMLEQSFEVRVLHCGSLFACRAHLCGGKSVGHSPRSSRDHPRQHSVQPRSGRQAESSTLFSSQHSVDVHDDIQVDDGDAQCITSPQQFPGVLLAEALASAYVAPHLEVVHTLVEEVLQVAVDSLRTQATHWASPLGERITEIVVEHVLVHAYFSCRALD